MSILILTTEPLVPGALAYAQSARSKHLSAVQLEWNLQAETKYEGNQFFKAACCYLSQPNWWWLPVETQILVAWIMFTHNLCNLLKGGLKPEPWLQKRSRYHDHVGANPLSMQGRFTEIRRLHWHGAECASSKESLGSLPEASVLAMEGLVSSRCCLMSG